VSAIFLSGVRLRHHYPMPVEIQKSGSLGP
jgi:hypothetical protein